MYFTEVGGGERDAQERSRISLFHALPVDLSRDPRKRTLLSRSARPVVKLATKRKPFESSHFTKPCNPRARRSNTLGSLSPSPSSASPSPLVVVIAIELFSELYNRFMTLFKAHESSAAEHTRLDDDGTLYPSLHGGGTYVYMYIYIDMHIRRAVLGTPGINYATSKSVYQDNVVPLSAEREWKLLNRTRESACAEINVHA